ncbi:hypothetical protein [Nitratireductor sp. XY-223]|uniref:hypothetical protein n=1 Tax=Nitratireductor sp. XY-223 TaxID=2561926 RepID=UPI0010AB328D|nr:hypothetical protein [Nitratireductor sp. XY-223]
MQLLRKTLVVTVLSVAAAACAALPTTEKVKSFGDAAASSSSAMKNALNADRLVAVRKSTEREAKAYVTGKAYRLVMTAEEESNLLKADDQVAVLSALDAYAKALVKAADKGVIDDLETASVNLGTAAASLGAAAVPTAAPIVGPAFKLTGRLLGLGLGNAYAAEIQSVIRATDPTVQVIATNMPKSLDPIALVIQEEVNRYEFERQNLLNAIRRDKKVDRLQLYKEYLVARNDVVVMQQQAISIRKSSGIFNKLGKAHKALADGSPDAAALVADFAAASAELAELIKAVRTVSGG